MGEARDPREAAPAPTSGTPERIEASAATEARLGPAIGAATARPIGLIGHLARSSPTARKELIDALNAQVGNHRVTRMIAAAGITASRSATEERARYPISPVGDGDLTPGRSPLAPRLTSGSVAPVPALAAQVNQPLPGPGGHTSGAGVGRTPRRVARAPGDDAAAIQQEIAVIQSKLNAHTRGMNEINRIANDLIDKKLGGPQAGYEAERTPRPRTSQTRLPNAGPRRRAPLLPTGEPPHPGAWRVRPLEFVKRDLVVIMTRGGTSAIDARSVHITIEDLQRRQRMLNAQLRNAQARLAVASAPQGGGSGGGGSGGGGSSGGGSTGGGSTGGGSTGGSRGAPYAPKTTFEMPGPRPIVETPPAPTKRVPGTTAIPASTTTMVPAKTTPLTATKGPLTPSTSEAPAARGGGVTMRGVVKFGAGVGLQTLVFWWLGARAAAAEEKSRAELVRTKLDPAVNARLKAESATAVQLTTENPSLPVYANVTADFDYEWTSEGIADNRSIEHVTDVRFVAIMISRQKLNKEQTIKQERSRLLQNSTYWATKRITYSLQVDFGETKAEHHWRELMHQAAEEAEAGRSARRRSGIGEGVPVTAQEVAERMNPWDDHTSRHERQKAAKVRWVGAYLHYTTGRKHLAWLHADATRYLDELEGRRSPEKPGPMDLPGVRDPADEKAVKDWLKATQGP